DRTVVRSVVAGTEIRPDIKSDIWLALLDQELPSSIVPLALMPADWTNRIHSAAVPVSAMNQSSAMGRAELISLRQGVKVWFLHGYGYRTPAIGALRFEPMRKGDSGYPIFTIVETNLVLLGHLTFEPGTADFLGPDYSLYGDDIQTAIKTL